MITREENVLIVETDTKLKKLISLAHRLKDPSTRTVWYNDEGSKYTYRISNFKTYIDCISFYSTVQLLLSEASWDYLPDNGSEISIAFDKAAKEVEITIKNIDSFAEKQGFVRDFLEEG